MFGCLTPMSLVFKSIPYLIAVVWILTSAIYDVTFVLQQSLFLCFYFYITDAIERLLAYSLKVDKQVIFSYINSTSLAVLFANFLGLSIYTRSYSRWTTLCASIYGLIIQLIEPMLMLIEIIQVIRFILSVGQMLREKIFDSEDDERMSSIMKGLTIVLTVAAVAIALLLGVSICQTQSSLFTTLTILIAALSGLMFVATFRFHHIIIDASLATLYITYLLCLASYEYEIKTSFQVNFQPKSVESDLFTLVARTESIIYALQKGFLSIALQLSPLFWLSFIIRIKCLTTFFEGHLCRTLFPSEEEVDDGYYEEEDEEGGRLAWLYITWKRIIGRVRFLSPTAAALVRISFIIGFTSILLQRFPSQSTVFILARYQWIVRIGQLFTTFVFYILAIRSLHEQDDDFEDDSLLDDY